MKPTTYKQVPLTDDDRDMLATIFDKRIRLFVPAYLLTMLLALRYSGFEVHNHTINWMHGMLVPETWVINMAAMMTILISTACYVFFKKIYCFKKDLKLGMKDIIPYTIVKKEYFPLTTQYFVGFDDPNYMHHEIDAATFNEVSEGDNMYIFRAVYSQYTFEINGRFSLM